MVYVEDLLDIWILDIYFLRFLYCIFSLQMPLLFLFRILDLVLLLDEVIDSEKIA